MSFFSIIAFMILIFVLCIVLYVESSGEIAKNKCVEYGKAVFSFEDSPVLSLTYKKQKVSQCGIVEVPLIIGGVKAQDTEYPHMAVIGYKSEAETINWLCGGSLISELFILTAAHCLNSPDNGPANKVLLGTTDIANLGESSQTKNVADKIPHPLYHPPSKYNDIALVKLASPVTFNKFVRPACINTQDNISDKTLTATGFGKVSYDANEGSKILMKVQLNIVPHENCKSHFFSGPNPTMSEGLSDNMICAGVMTGGKDTCQGDSGGPLQTVLNQPECMYSIIGVTSFGKFCGFPNSPSVYTKIASYVDWIETTVWN